MNVIGVQIIDYKSKKTGKQVTGVRLHVTYPAKDCDGVCAEQFYCRNDAFPEGIPKPGDDIDLLFNRYGNVQEVHFK